MCVCTGCGSLYGLVEARFDSSDKMPVHTVSGSTSSLSAVRLREPASFTWALINYLPTVITRGFAPGYLLKMSRGTELQLGSGTFS